MAHGLFSSMDNEKCKIFIELYKRHRSLWDPKHYDYHNSAIRENSWREISSILNLPVAELKNKMKSLMGTYRRERSRQKKSLITRSGKGDIYVSKWFAFDCFNFLSDRDNTTQAMEVLTKTETDVSMDEQNGMDIAHAEVLIETVDEMHAGTSYNAPQTNCADLLKLPPTSAKKKRRMTSPPSEEGHTLEKLFTMLQERMDVISTDPYFTFGQHVANELRKYDARTVTHVKHAINNIIFDADMRRIQQQLPAEGDAQASGMGTSGLVETASVPDYTNTALRGTRKSRK
ncbi:uncharacterized protein LOC143207035 [Lasioglossum baleicum]|uniref:uncharacterized protein LOC143207035 n=1 Tax=Lasioglossum baleicum TaxID=434251 RepID=UPI003FCD6516